jgi:flagellar motor component MotA
MEIKPKGLVVAQRDREREFTRPVRFLILCNGDMIALMTERTKNQFCIYGLEGATKKLFIAGIYTKENDAVYVFRKLADAISKSGLEKLEAEANEAAEANNYELFIAKCNRYLRLQMANERLADEREALDRVAAARFARLSPAEQQAEIDELQGEYLRLKAREAEADGDD